MLPIGNYHCISVLANKPTCYERLVTDPVQILQDTDPWFLYHMPV